MSESKHTPGLLAIQPYVDAIHLLAEDGCMIADVGDRPLDAHGMPPDNARRLVVCWNACDGLSTEALERGVVKDLLAACKAARVEMTWLGAQHEFRPGGSCDKALKQLESAIAAAEEVR